MNFNYYQPMNEYYVNNSAEFMNKDPQSEEQWNLLYILSK